MYALAFTLLSCFRARNFHCKNFAKHSKLVLFLGLHGPLWGVVTFLYLIYASRSRHFLPVLTVTRLANFVSSLPTKQP